jgi:hypothetical protein
MFNKNDLNALIITVLIILLGYASIYAFVYLGEYLNLFLK